MYPDEPEGMDSRFRPTGPGGNHAIINQDEEEILDRVTTIPMRIEGAQDSDFH